MHLPINKRRTLYIGLGGAGAQTILHLKKLYIDAYGDVPPMVKFLVIDTDKAICDKSIIARSGKYIGLNKDEICICVVSDAKEVYQNNSERYNWIPPKNLHYIPGLSNCNTGHLRSSGRFMLSYNASYVEHSIKQKLAEIYTSISDDSNFCVNLNEDAVEFPAEINLVSSAAGGTGGGMLIDILVLVAKILREKDLFGFIYPWIILPDVYRSMAPGLATSHVYSNAYGLIRELDYLYHLEKDNKEPIDLIFDKVHYLDKRIGLAHLINNKNGGGIVCDHFDQLSATVSLSMFLSSISSPIDIHPSIALQYDVNNKKAHYLSAGSAEIVYDNHAVGNVIAKGIISQICNKLCHIDSFDAFNEVNAWTISESVAIQEYDADILTDSILPKHAPFSVIVDKDSDQNTIKTAIFTGSEADNVIAEARNNEANKLEIVKGELVTKMNEILNSQNGVGAAKAFLESLLDNIAVCKEDMTREWNVLQNSLLFSVDWESEISCLRSRIFKLFKRDIAEALQNKINDYIAQKRDLLRHKLAIEFYADLMSFVKVNIVKLNEFGKRLKAIEIKQINDISAIQDHAKNPSQFQIYLHNYEVDNFTLPNIAETSTLFRSKHPIYELVGKSEMELNDIFYNFAKDQTSVVEAVNVSIEEKMSKLSESQLKEIFTKVKEMSSPLWSIDFQGLQGYKYDLITILTIGVHDRSVGIIQSNFVDEFTFDYIKPTFATTHQTDRITFCQSQCYSPAYAVNNMRRYMRDAEEKLNLESYPVSYLDEKWNQRMLIEGFDLMPKQDTVLPNWVFAIICGLIIYNESHNMYYIESEQGEENSANLLELGQRRDLAFEQFQLRGLDREVEARIQKMIHEKGRAAVAEIIKNVKSQLRNYVTNHAQLSPVELDCIRAKDPQYQNVRYLLEAEIHYIKDLVFD